MRRPMLGDWGSAGRPAPTSLQQRAPAERRGLRQPWECARMGSATSRSCARGRRAMRCDMLPRARRARPGRRPSVACLPAALRPPQRWPRPRLGCAGWFVRGHRATQEVRAPKARVRRPSRVTCCASVHLAGFAREAHSHHRAPAFRSTCGGAAAGRSPRTAPPDQSSMRKSICGLRGFAPRFHACTAEGHADNVSATMAFVSRRRTRYERKTSLQL